MKLFVVYGSEDEGFRFPVGKVYQSIDEARTLIAERLATRKVTSTEFVPTKEQIEYSSPPLCHGKVVAMYCDDGDDYRGMCNDPDKGYVYDWHYIIELSVGE